MRKSVNRAMASTKISFISLHSVDRAHSLLSSSPPRPTPPHEHTRSWAGFHSRASRAARLKEAGREGYRRVKKAADIAWIKTARAAERVRRVAFTFLPSSVTKRANRRRSAASTSSVVPHAPSPVTCASPLQAAPAAASTECGRESQRRFGHSSTFPTRACFNGKLFRPRFRVPRFSFRVSHSALLPPRFRSTRSTVSTAADSAAGNRSASSSPVASRAASSAPPLDPPPEDSVATSAAFFASACFTYQSTASTSSTSVSACSSLPRNISSSSAPSFSARCNHSDLLTNPTAAAATAPSAVSLVLFPPAFTESVSLAETRAETHAASLDDCRAIRSSSWKRAMSIAIPTCGEAQEPECVEAGEESGETAELATAETAEAAEELGECDRLSGCAQDTAVDIDSLWEAAAAAELEAEERATTAAAAAAGAKRWRGSWKAVTPRSRANAAAPKTLKFEISTANKTPTRTPVLTPRGFVLEPKKGWGALAESVASALAENQSGAEPAHSPSCWRTAGGFSEEDFAKDRRKSLDNARSGGNTVSAISPPPPSTPRFLSALRSSFRRSAPDAVPPVADSWSSPYEHHRDTVDCVSVEWSKRATTIPSATHSKMKPSKSFDNNDLNSSSNNDFSASILPSSTSSLRSRRGLTPFENLQTEEKHPGQARQPKLQARNGASAPDFRIFEITPTPAFFDAPSSNRVTPELTWEHLSDFAAGRLERERPVVGRGCEGGDIKREEVERCVVEGGVVEWGALKGGAVEKDVEEWGAVVEDDCEELKSPGMAPAGCFCGVGGIPTAPSAQQDQQQAWHIQQQRKVWQQHLQKQQHPHRQQQQKQHMEEGWGEQEQEREEKEDDDEWQRYLEENQPDCAAAMGCMPFSMSRNNHLQCNSRGRMFSRSHSSSSSSSRSSSMSSDTWLLTSVEKLSESGLVTPRGSGRDRFRFERTRSGGSGGGATATVVRYVPRFARHKHQRSVVREVARHSLNDMVGVGVR
ncbi:unnamed protein product [Closterium sp. NIES-54]